MLTPSLIESLPELPAPILTVYLDTNREKTANRTLEPGYLINLGSQAKVAKERLGPEDWRSFQKQVERTEIYLRTHPPTSKGVAIFAGRNSWRFVPLEAAVEDAVHWGTPNLAPLLWLWEEHKPCGIVTVDQKRAQFFVLWFGKMRILEDKECTPAPTKKKEMGPVARAFGVRVSRGMNRDVFRHHLDAQYSHYYRQVAERIARLCHAEYLQSLFLFGPSKVITAIQRGISLPLRKKIVCIEEDLAWASKSELQRRIKPILVAHERERESMLVEALLSGEGGVVIGIDETLVRLQQGNIRDLVVVKGLDASLKRCGKCLWVDRVADLKCPACGRERYEVTLRDILPELARRHKVSMEVVSSEAGRTLEKAGGMAAWLREFERKEYGEHLSFAEQY